MSDLTKRSDPKKAQIIKDLQHELEILTLQKENALLRTQIAQLKMAEQYENVIEDQEQQEFLQYISQQYTIKKRN